MNRQVYVHDWAGHLWIHGNRFSHEPHFGHTVAIDLCSLEGCGRSKLSCLDAHWNIETNRLHHDESYDTDEDDERRTQEGP
jgi:hypothetical protein